MTHEPPTLTLTLPASDWQLLITIAQQAMAPYQRLGEVLQTIQRQAQVQEKQHQPNVTQPGSEAQAQGEIPESLGRLAHALQVAP